MERMTKRGFFRTGVSHNAEKYAYWRANYEMIEARYLEGHISADELDRLDANMLERLGMDKWSQEEWLYEQAEWEKGQ